MKCTNQWQGLKTLYICTNQLSKTIARTWGRGVRLWWKNSSIGEKCRYRCIGAELIPILHNVLTNSTSIYVGLFAQVNYVTRAYYILICQFRLKYSNSPGASRTSSSPTTATPTDRTPPSSASTPPAKIGGSSAPSVSPSTAHIKIMIPFRSTSSWTTVWGPSARTSKRMNSLTWSGESTSPTSSYLKYWRTSTRTIAP